MNLNKMINNFRSIVDVIEDGGSVSQFFYNLVKNLNMNDYEAMLTRIIENFGLLTNYNWWNLIFRSNNGIAAYIFLDLLKQYNKPDELGGLKRKKIKEFINHSSRWANPPPLAGNVSRRGTGPWMPDDDPYGGGGPPPVGGGGDT